MITTTHAQDVPVAATPRPRPYENEDWLAVWGGFLLIGLVLVGVRPELPVFAWASSGDLSAKVWTAHNLWSSLIVGGLLAVLSATPVLLMGGSFKRFAMGFPLIFVLGWLAQVVAGNAAVSNWGFEYVVFAFLLGLAISNTTAVPPWLLEAVRTEYYIKTGLVLLGAGILFSDLMQAGLLGIAQALLVVTAVWFVCFWLARRLHVDDEFATILASAVSICGVSAAIAACGAIQGDRKKLSYVTSLVVIVAAPMMVVMPQIIHTFGIPDAVGGAWLGGTLDTSASVVAAGEMISSQARNAGVVVKLSQNVLIGLAAFLLTIWWSLRDPNRSDRGAGAAVIWERFPKFVLGFAAASFLFSFLIRPSLVNETKAVLAGLRTWWFALAFTSIGLETRFTELVKAEQGRPALAFLGGQAFNVLWTLILAYLLFGGVLFPVPVFN
jgi:uncharacterized integral membrane protein (TIGR00698 family)